MLMTTDQAERWSQAYPSRLTDLWAGVRSFAVSLDAAESHEERTSTTQAFLFAAGNFKRQTPIFVSPSNEPDVAWEAKEDVSLEGVGTVVRDDFDSWRCLDNVPGIGVSTATTLLSALWPDSHAIFDVLTVQAATALRGAAGHWDGPISPGAAISMSPPHFGRGKWLTWDCYRWYRGDCVLPRAEDTSLPPQTIERALFQVIQWQFRNDPAPPNETWDAYGRRLVVCLEREPG